MIDKSYRKISDKNDVYKTYEVFIPGWKYPVIIDYTIVKMYNQVYLIWFVNKVNFPFKIEYKQFLKEDDGDYFTHFTKVLTTLRKDIISWYKQGLKEEYMKKYYNLFKDYILF